MKVLSCQVKLRDVQNSPILLGKIQRHPKVQDKCSEVTDPNKAAGSISVSVSPTLTIISDWRTVSGNLQDTIEISSVVLW